MILKSYYLHYIKAHKIMAFFDEKIEFQNFKTNSVRKRNSAYRILWEINNLNCVSYHIFFLLKILHYLRLASVKLD